MKFILTFLPSIAVVMTVFLVLLGMGIIAIHKRFGGRTAAFYLLGLFVPLAGTALYSLTPRAAFNVRYTIVAFPFFCIFVGTALAYLARASKTLGALALVAVTSISLLSLYNHFTNPRYANEDIRSAITFLRQARDKDPLLAIGAPYSTNRYLTLGYGWSTDSPECAHDYCEMPHNSAGKARRAFWTGESSKNLVPRIEEFLLTQNISSAYLVLARDWDKSRETAIRNAWGGTPERSFPGVKVFRIARSMALQASEPRGKLVSTGNP